jgi:mannosyltransferase OCH1-like enzyme
MNSNYLYELWDDEDNRNFVKREFPWLLRIYNSYSAEIYRADIIRYLYLYIFGGMYADLDTKCLRPLDHLRGLSDIIVGRMGSDPEFPHSIPNAFLASTPRQEFWLLVIALIVLFAYKPGRPEELTGPVILKKAVDLYCHDSEGVWVRECIKSISTFLKADQQPEPHKSDVMIADKSWFYCIDWSDPEHNRMRWDILTDPPSERVRHLLEDAWTVTYWAHTWE